MAVARQRKTVVSMQSGDEYSQCGAESGTADNIDQIVATGYDAQNRHKRREAECSDTEKLFCQRFGI